MNKLVFLTGILTALLFIGTAHGRQFDEEALELEELQALMQDSNAVMETVDEDEIAEAQFAYSASYIVGILGCPRAEELCKNRPVVCDPFPCKRKFGYQICAAIKKLCSLDEKFSKQEN